MLRSLSAKAFFAILAAVLFAVALIGVIYKYVEQRERMRVHAAAATGGDPRRGEAMFIQYGCGSCHALKNVRTATGTVGPPLDGIALRAIIGGHLANKPGNMERWIRDPQHIAPGTAMPDLNVGEEDARDMTSLI
jgi:cytochrome c2